MSALTTHYASLVEKLTTEAAKIQEDMRNAVATANPAVAEIHNLLRKTMENLNNLREKLDAKKTSKMNWIKNNPHKEKTRPPRGRGGGDRGRGERGGGRNQRGGGAQREGGAQRAGHRQRGGKANLTRDSPAFNQEQMKVLRDMILAGLSDLYESHRGPPQPQGTSSAHPPQHPPLKEDANTDAHFQERAGPSGATH